MRKIKMRSIFYAVAILAFGAFLGCQSDVTGPNPGQVLRGATDEEDYGMIYGYVKDAFNQPISGALVTWYPSGHPEEPLGSKYTSPMGYYQIDGESWWEEYQDDLLEGTAEHPEYETGYNYIYGYNFGQTYRRGFRLYSAY